MSESSGIIAAGNRYLLGMLFRRFRTWPVENRRWLLARLESDHREASA